MPSPYEAQKVQGLISQYRANPDMFNQDQLDELERLAADNLIEFKRKQSPFSVTRALQQATAGFVEGLTTLDLIPKEPRNTGEAIFRQLGHLAGFAPGIMKAPIYGLAKITSKLTGTKMKKVLGGTITKATIAGIDRLDAIAVPMLASRATKRLIDKQLQKTGLESMDFLARGARTRAIAEEALGLASASAVSSVWKGTDAIVDSYIGGAIAGGAFGGIGNFVSLGNLFKGTPQQIDRAEKILRTGLGSMVTGLPTTLRNEPTEMQIYEYLLGGFFGYNTRPAYKAAAQEWIVKPERPQSENLDPESSKDFKEYTEKTREYILNEHEAGNIKENSQNLAGSSGMSLSFLERFFPNTPWKAKAEAHFNKHKKEGYDQKDINRFYRKQASRLQDELSRQKFVEAVIRENAVANPQNEDFHDPVEIRRQKIVNLAKGFYEKADKKLYPDIGRFAEAMEKARDKSIVNNKPDPELFIQNIKKVVGEDQVSGRGKKIYDVKVDMYENPKTKDKTGDFQDVWVVDNLSQAREQLASIKKGEGGGVNFANEIVKFENHYILKHTAGDDKHIYIRGTEPRGLIPDTKGRVKDKPYFKQIGSEAEARLRSHFLRDAEPMNEVIAIKFDDKVNMPRYLKFKGEEINNVTIGERYIELPLNKLGEGFQFLTHYIDSKGVPNKILSHRMEGQDIKFNLEPKEISLMQDTLAEKNQYIYSGVKDKGVLMLSTFKDRIGNQQITKEMLFDLLSNGNSRVREAVAESYKLSLEAEKPIFGDTTLHERKWVSNVMNDAINNGLVKGSDITGVSKLLSSGFGKSVADVNKRMQLLANRMTPVSASSFAQTNPNGNMRIVIASDDAFQKVKGMTGISDTDGGMIIRQKFFDAGLKGVGLDADAGHYKPVIVGRTNLGILATKSNGQRANEVWNKFMEQNNIDAIVFDSGAKLRGLHETSEIGYQRGWLKTKEGKQTLQTEIFPTDLKAYEMPVESLQLSLGTFEKPYKQVIGEEVPIQLYGQTNKDQASGFADIYLKEVLDRSVLGSAKGKKLVEEYNNVLKSFDKIPAKEKEAIQNEFVDLFERHDIGVFELPVDFVLERILRNEDPKLTALFMNKINKLDKEGYFDRDFEFDADSDYTQYHDLNKSISESMRDQYFTRNTMFIENWGNALKKYFVRRYSNPFVEHGGKSWLKAFTPDQMAYVDIDPRKRPKGQPREKITTDTKGRDLKAEDWRTLDRGELYLDEAFRLMPISTEFLPRDIVAKINATKKTKGAITLGEAWNYYKRSNPERLHKNSKEYKGWKNTFSLTVIRTPADSMSGTRVLRFRGFTGQRGAGSFTHHFDNNYLGGADKDADSIKIFQGFSEKLRNYFEKISDERIHLDPDNPKKYNEKYANELDSQFHEKSAIIKGKPEEVLKRFRGVKKEEPNFEFYNAFKFSPAYRHIAAQGAASGKNGLGYGLSSAVVMRQWVDYVKAKGGSYSFPFYDAKSGKTYLNDVTLKEYNVEGVPNEQYFRDLIYKIVNKSADASNDPTVIPYTRFRDMLFDSMFDVNVYELARPPRVSDKGIETMRGSTFGNPFIDPAVFNKDPKRAEWYRKQGFIKAESREDANNSYENWIRGTDHLEVFPERRQKIVEALQKGSLIGKTLKYFQPNKIDSHAHRLARLAAEYAPGKMISSGEKKYQDIINENFNGSLGLLAQSVNVAKPRSRTRTISSQRIDPLFGRQRNPVGGFKPPEPLKKQGNKIVGDLKWKSYIGLEPGESANVYLDGSQKRITNITQPADKKLNLLVNEFPKDAMNIYDLAFVNSKISAKALGDNAFKTSVITSLPLRLNKAGVNFASFRFNNLKEAYKKFYRDLDVEVGVGSAISKKDPLPKTINGYKIEYRPTGRKREKDTVAASVNKKNKIITIDRELLKKKYQEKAWTKPKVKGVFPLQKDQFKTYEQFERFVIEHETAHTKFFRRRNKAEKDYETKGEYENRINKIALSKVTETGQLASYSNREIQTFINDHMGILTSDMLISSLGKIGTALNSNRVPFALESYSKGMGQIATIELANKHFLDIHQSLINKGIKGNIIKEFIPQIMGMNKKLNKMIIDRVPAAEIDTAIALGNKRINDLADKYNINPEPLMKYFHTILLSPITGAKGKSGYPIINYQKLIHGSERIDPFARREFYSKIEDVYNRSVDKEADMQLEAGIPTEVFVSKPKKEVINTVEKVIQSKALDMMAINKPQVKEIKKFRKFLDENPFVAENFNEWFKFFTGELTGRGIPRSATDLKMEDIVAINRFMKQFHDPNNLEFKLKYWHLDPRFVDSEMAMKGMINKYKTYYAPVKHGSGKIRREPVYRFMSPIGAISNYVLKSERGVSKDRNAADIVIKPISDILSKYTRNQRTELFKELIDARESGNKENLSPVLKKLDAELTRFFKDGGSKWIYTFDSKGEKVSDNTGSWKLDDNFNAWYKDTKGNMNKYMRWNKEGVFDFKHFRDTVLDKDITSSELIRTVGIDGLKRYEYEKRMMNYFERESKKDSKINKGTFIRNYRLGKSRFSGVGEKNTEQYFPHQNFGHNEAAQREFVKSVNKESLKLQKQVAQEYLDKNAEDRKNITPEEWIESEKVGDKARAKFIKLMERKAQFSTEFFNMKDLIDHRDLTDADLDVKLSELGFDSKIGALEARLFDLKGYDKSPEVITDYHSKLINGWYKNLVAIKGDYEISNMKHRMKDYKPSKAEKKKFSKSKRYNNYVDVWADYTKLYMQSVLGHQSYFPQEIMIEIERGIDPLYLKDKRNMFYLTSDQNMVKAYEKLWQSKKWNKVPFVGKTLKDAPKDKVARKEYFSRKIHDFGRMEAQYELMTLLANTGTWSTNIFSGNMMTIASAGFRNFRNSFSDKKIFERLLSNDKGEAVLKLFNGTQVKNKKDLFEWLKERGVMDDFIQNEFEYNEPLKNGLKKAGVNISDFSRDISKAIKGRGKEREESVLQVVNRYGVKDTMVKYGGFFMQHSERVNRLNAFIAHGLQAVDKFGPEGKNLNISDDFVFEMALKGIENTQFLYQNAQRPAFMRTATGKVLSRFKLFVWNSIRVRKEFYNQAKLYGFRNGTPEYERFKDLFMIDMFMMALGGAFMFSIFDTALAPPYDWIQSLADWLYGDKRERDMAFFGSKLGPANLLKPPIARVPEAMIELMTGDWEKFSDYTAYTMFPFGRAVRQGKQIYERPERVGEVLFRLPINKVNSRLERVKRRSLQAEEAEEALGSI